ncbi:MAG: hypothetical protein VKK80_10810 [Prochlorothrix sp.]|nr:hypothetical protein [Prochlorothrix sp.]
MIPTSGLHSSGTLLLPSLAAAPQESQAMVSLPSTLPYRSTKTGATADSQTQPKRYSKGVERAIDRPTPAEAIP